MKKIILFTVFILTATFSVQAQDDNPTPKEKIQQLEDQKTQVRATEKERLKTEIQKIEDLKSDGKITAKEAEIRKEKAADQRARNIENQLDLIDLNIALIERNEADSTNIGNYINVGSLLTKTAPEEPIDSVPNSTQVGFSVGLGVSSVLGGKKTDQLEGLPLSGIFGFSLTSVLCRENPNWHLSYGYAISLNQFKIQNNQSLKMEGNTNVLEEFPSNLEDQNFRFSNLLFPVHFEFNKTTIKYNDDEAYYDFHSNWTYGLGGFAGFKLSSTQNFDYEIDGRFIEETRTRNYNTNNFIYGASAYVRFYSVQLEAKYHLNELFKNSEVNGNMFAVRLSIFY